LTQFTRVHVQVHGTDMAFSDYTRLINVILYQLNVTFIFLHYPIKLQLI